MPKVKPRLYASSGSLEGITALVRRFYGDSPTVKLVAESDELWQVHNAYGRIDGMRVILKKRRYRFESLQVAN